MRNKVVIFPGGRRVVFGAPKRRKAAASKGNLPFTFARGERVSVPTGKRGGQEFSRGGKKYLVVSYTTKNGVLIRYGQPIKG